MKNRFRRSTPEPVRPHLRLTGIWRTDKALTASNREYISGSFGINAIWNGAGTATWTDVSFNLPDFPINQVVRDDVLGDLYASWTSAS